MPGNGSRPQNALLGAGNRLYVNSVGALTPVLDTDPPGQLQLRRADCPARISGPAHLNEGYGEWNPEQHT